jgi:uncharacterized membrane protein YraQ (UPF0718 family)
MNIKNKLKKNVFTLVVVLLYAFTFIYKSDIGVLALSNSIYYFKELLSIMPVVLVLTALLDFWVPKRVIQDNLGKDARGKGMFFSFLLGGISAGPIYAAFPITVMLLKKGASIRNVIIILSSWAVIKVPMLVNEVKFLGPEFMIVRWILTVIAIIIFSYIGARIVKKEDIVFENEKFVEEIFDEEIFINCSACMGCSLCTKTYPSLFEMYNKKAYVKQYDIDDIDSTKLNDAIDNCPTKAIKHKEQ